VIRPGERPLHALRERGVEYVEVRLMDLDPFEDIGIAASTMRVIDVFLLHCLLSDSPPDSPEENAALARNQQATASRGREPGLMLERGGREVALQDWAQELLDGCLPLAAGLDEALGGNAYRSALAQAHRQLAAPDTLPSARVLAGLREQGSYTRFVRAQSEAIRARVLALPLDATVQQRLLHEAADSIAEQARIEAADTLPFETFREQYTSRECLAV
jgi:glutamate--cysteine ligase